MEISKKIMDLNKIEIKQKINSEIEKIKHQIIDLEELTKPIAPDCAIGRVSRMDAINNKAINENALQKAQNKLKGMEFALQNVDQDDFGKCAKCQGEIPLGRILLVPHSRFCVRCAS